MSVIHTALLSPFLFMSFTIHLRVPLEALILTEDTCSYISESGFRVLSVECSRPIHVRSTQQREVYAVQSL
jgi:hypothetical protein